MKAEGQPPPRCATGRSNSIGAGCVGSDPVSVITVAGPRPDLCARRACGWLTDIAVGRCGSIHTADTKAVDVAADLAGIRLRRTPARARSRRPGGTRYPQRSPPTCHGLASRGQRCRWRRCPAQVRTSLKAEPSLGCTGPVAGRRQEVCGPALYRRAPGEPGGQRPARWPACAQVILGKTVGEGSSAFVGDRRAASAATRQLAPDRLETSTADQHERARVRAWRRRPNRRLYEAQKLAPAPRPEARAGREVLKLAAATVAPARRAVARHCRHPRRACHLPCRRHALCSARSRGSMPAHDAQGRPAGGISLPEPSFGGALLRQPTAFCSDLMFGHGFCS